MSAIIAAIIAALGPYLVKWIIELIEGLLNKAEKNVVTTGDDVRDAEALIDEAIRITPRRQIGRRNLLRFVRALAPRIMSGAKPTKADRDELAALAGRVERK